MINQHPITPPPELVGQWLCSEDYLSDVTTKSTMTITSSRLQNVATQAARWGADQELEICVNYVDNKMSGNKARELRAIRRPKPPSLKEQALAAQQRMWDGTSNHDDWNLIRRALETLDD
jgi:hypothetical protein